MMYNPRFGLGDGDGRLFENCDTLKIHLYKVDEGGVTAYFEMSGSVRAGGDEDDGPLAPRSNMGFVRDPLVRFEKVKD